MRFHVPFSLPTPQGEDSTIHPIPTHQHIRLFLYFKIVSLKDFVTRSYFFLQPYTGDKFLSTEILLKGTVCLSHQFLPPTLHSAIQTRIKDSISMALTSSIDRVMGNIGVRKEHRCTLVNLTYKHNCNQSITY